MPLTHLLHASAPALDALLRFAQADPGTPAGAAGAAGAAAKVAAHGAAKARGGGDGLVSIVMMIGIFVVFWFLILRPQQKRAKEHKDFLGTLKVGTKVVTNSGLFGRVTAIDGSTVDLQIAPKVTVKMLKSQVAGLEGNAQQAVETRQQGR